MKKEFTLSIFTEDVVGILNRVSVIFARRNINIDSITASLSEFKGIHRYIIVINVEVELVKKLIKQLEKQVDVLKAFYHLNDEAIFQEIGLYKLPKNILVVGSEVEKVISKHNAKALTTESNFIIIEKIGQSKELSALYDDLKPFGLMEFVKSGRLVISKSIMNLNL